MKKRIIQTSILLNLITLIIIAQSCQSGSPLSEVPKDSKKVDSTKIEANSNSLSEAAQPLIGIWKFGQEPLSYDFKADGTFREYAPKGALGPEAEEQIYNQGTWEVKDGMLILVQADKTENVKLNWLEEHSIFLGDIESEYSPEYGSKENFASEMGWVRVP